MASVIRIPATHGWIFPSHVHLQMLEEVVVLIAGEGHHHPHCARQCGVHQGVTAARDERCLGQADYRLTNVCDCNAFSLLSSSTEQPSIPEAFGACRIFLHIVVGALWQPDQ